MAELEVLFIACPEDKHIIIIIIIIIIIPVTGRVGPEGCEISRLQHFV
jgi:hypothetical protein